MEKPSEAVHTVLWDTRGAQGARGVVVPPILLYFTSMRPQESSCLQVHLGEGGGWERGWRVPKYGERSLACIQVDVRSMAEGGRIAGSRTGVESKGLESEIGAASEWDRRGSLASCDRR